MDINELGRKLNDMYFNSEKGETVAMIHLFAIKYASEILQTGEAMRTVAIVAGIPETYGVEINKGVKLSKYVEPKKGI